MWPDTVSQKYCDSGLLQTHTHAQTHTNCSKDLLTVKHFNVCPFISDQPHVEGSTRRHHEADRKSLRALNAEGKHSFKHKM